MLGRRGETSTSLVAKLDASASNLHPQRQSNNVCGIPLKHFNKISELPKIKSQEYPSIILVLMVLLGTEGLYMDPDLTINVQHALSGLYLMWYSLKRHWVYRNEVEKLPSFICRCSQPASHACIIMMILSTCMLG